MTVRKRSQAKEPAQQSTPPEGRARRQSSRVTKPPPDFEGTELEDVERADDDEDDDELLLARDYERAIAAGVPAARPTTLPHVNDTDELPVVDPGVSIDPEDRGVQFLRDATEQDNFESEAQLSAAADLEGTPLPHVMISDATLDAAMQNDADWPSSGAVRGPTPEAAQEPFERDVDLTEDAIRVASLFDQPVPESQLDEADDDAALEGETVEPSLHTEDPSEFEAERDREMRRVRHEMLKRRQRSEGKLPSDEEE